MTDPLPTLSWVFTRSELMASGLGRRAWDRVAASGAWHRLAPGTCCTRERWDEADAVLRTRLVAVAQHRRWPGTSVSHLSAAALHGLPLPLLDRRGSGLHATWLTADPSSGTSSRASAALRLEVARLPEAHVRRVGPSAYGPHLTVTSLARTVADCLRRLPAHDAVAIADAAARRSTGAAGRTGAWAAPGSRARADRTGRGVTRAQVAQVLAEHGGWPGSRRARDLLDLVDPRRESWLESVSAVAFQELGLPPGEPQVEVRTPDGRLVARVDTCWRDLGVVGEADGWAKYTADDPSPSGARRALRAEKQREDALRDLGLEVVRWDTRGVLDPAGRAATAERFHRAVARADPARVRARLVPVPPPAGWVRPLSPG